MLALRALMHKYWRLVANHALIRFLHEGGIAHKGLALFRLLQGELGRVDKIYRDWRHSELHQDLTVDRLITYDQV